MLRNLRDRLAAEHPAAHSALLPILADHRTLLEVRLAAEPADPCGAPGSAGRSIDGERDVQALVSQWAAEPEDPAGLRGGSGGRRRRDASRRARAAPTPRRGNRDASSPPHQTRWTTTSTPTITQARCRSGRSARTTPGAAAACSTAWCRISTDCCRRGPQGNNVPNIALRPGVMSRRGEPPQQANLQTKALSFGNLRPTRSRADGGDHRRDSCPGVDRDRDSCTSWPSTSS